jgi:hypothetical protein
MSVTAMTNMLAHTGSHDLTTGDGVLHALTAPDHLLAAAACVVGAWVVLFVYRRLSARTPRVVENQTSSASK